MIKKKLYRYIGRNGILTSYVLLENIDHIDMYCLEASKGKVLTNGEKNLKSVQVFADEVDNWTEIDDPNADKIN